jgi:hypothetical protein
MNRHAALSEALAQTVRNVPGVAFLKPGIADRLRAARTAPTGPAPAGPTPTGTGGLRVTRAEDDGSWRVDIQVVTRADARVLDVARATRAAVLDLLAATDPSGTARISVTVTGTV